MSSNELLTITCSIVDELSIGCYVVDPITSFWTDASGQVLYDENRRPLVIIDYKD